MKKNSFKIFALIATGIFMLGCDKTLDLAPIANVSDGSFWKVPGDFRLAVNAFYLPGSTANGTHDQNSDLTMGHGTNGTSAGQILLENGPGWAGNYQNIRAINRVLENYELAVDIQEETARYAAEARFFRAWQYSNLVRTFGDVPLVKTTLTLDSEELDAPRTPRADVVAFILEDIDWAIANLPSKNEFGGADQGRVSKGAALALKSRIFLFEGTWAKYHNTGADANAYLTQSLNASQAIIDSGEYSIYMGTSTGTAYRHLFVEQGQPEGQENVESILAVRYDESQDRFHNTSRWVTTNHNSPTKQLADLYLCTDGLPIGISPLFQGYDTMTSEFENRDPRMSQTIITPNIGIDNLGNDISVPLIGNSSGRTRTGYLPYKFYSDIEDDDTCRLGRCSYDYMVMRFAEVLLNHAEVLYELNGSISDAQLDATINKIRDRVGLVHLDNNLVTTYGLNMLWQIRNERSVELVYEGFRYDDLRRWKESENFLPVSLLGVKYDGDVFTSNAEGFLIADDVSNRTWDDKFYLAPVPVTEITLNPNLLPQNPGWE